MVYHMSLRLSIETARLGAILWTIVTKEVQVFLTAHHFRGEDYMLRFARKRLAATLISMDDAASAKASGDLALMLIRAEYDSQPIPILTKVDSALTVDGAYGVQKAYIAMKLAGGDAIAGFKAGLTDEGMQKRFGMTAPVMGVLLRSGILTGAPILDKSRFGALMLETEIAFVIGQPISESIPDVASLKGKIRSVMPAIEVPDLDFADIKALKPADLIASNVSMRQFIVGREVVPDAFNLNAVKVTLYHNDVAVNTGVGEDALGDQWHTALWMINDVVEQGYKIEPGHILMTGALGSMLPGKQGNYIADYGDMGRIDFTIR